MFCLLCVCGTHLFTGADLEEMLLCQQFDALDYKLLLSIWRHRWRRVWRHCDDVIAVNDVIVVLGTAPSHLVVLVFIRLAQISNWSSSQFSQFLANRQHVAPFLGLIKKYTPIENLVGQPQKPTFHSSLILGQVRYLIRVLWVNV